MLSCLCAEDAQIVWMKNEEDISAEDEHFNISSSEGENMLEIINPGFDDAGSYTCKITKFGKQGEDQTGCDLRIIGLLNSIIINCKNLFNRFSSQVC